MRDRPRKAGLENDADQRVSVFGFFKAAEVRNFVVSLTGDVSQTEKARAGESIALLPAVVTVAIDGSELNGEERAFLAFVAPDGGF